MNIAWIPLQPVSVYYCTKEAISSAFVSTHLSIHVQSIGRSIKQRDLVT